MNFHDWSKYTLSIAACAYALTYVLPNQEAAGKSPAINMYAAGIGLYSPNIRFSGRLASDEKPDEGNEKECSYENLCIQTSPTYSMMDYQVQASGII